MNDQFSVQTHSTFKQRISALAQLTRWQEHVLFTLPATLAGVNMALWHTDARFHLWHVTAIMLANLFAVTFAFMVNDIEDADDDARDAQRAARNAVSNGHLSLRMAWLATVGMGGIALVFFMTINRATALIGIFNLLLGFLYSWRKVRLKAWPVIDVISHLLMLSSLLFLGGYFAFDRSPGLVWWIAVGVGLISAYGQLYNQLRDWALDQAAGLHNTAHILGPRYTRWAMYGCLILAALSLGFTGIWGLWPRGIVAIPIMLGPLFIVFKTAHDMRGSIAVEITGQAQWGFMVIATVMMVIWLVVIAVQPL